MSPSEKSTPPAGEDFADDGPILLPEGACCGTCHYSATITAPGPSVIEGQPGAPRTVRFCRRFPPSAVMVYSPQGGTMTGQAPPVADASVCFEYDAALPTLFLGSEGEG